MLVAVQGAPREAKVETAKYDKVKHKVSTGVQVRLDGSHVDRERCTQHRSLLSVCFSYSCSEGQSPHIIVARHLGARGYTKAMSDLGPWR